MPERLIGKSYEHSAIYRGLVIHVIADMQTHHIETEEGIVSQSPRGCYPIPDDKPDINGWSPMMCAALSGDSRAAVKVGPVS